MTTGNDDLPDEDADGASDPPAGTNRDVVRFDGQNAVDIKRRQARPAPTRLERLLRSTASRPR